jgi:hypothetical protein
MGHEGHDKLNFNNIGGPFIRRSERLDAVRPGKATLRFLDALAERRETLWRRLRLNASAEVTVLPPPWPRGLPVQFLLCADLKDVDHGYDLPFLYERAEKVVFVDADAALQKPPHAVDAHELRSAIGPFVEDWEASSAIVHQGRPEYGRSPKEDNETLGVRCGPAL